MESLTGKMLGQYQIMEELGRGGMAVVYKAYQPSLTRYVAIKVLPPQFSFDHEFIERFVREARGAAVVHHPNIITIHDVSEQDGMHYFVMEYLAGKTLDAVIAETPMPLPRIAHIIRQVADALDYAHSQGLIHRDIKPSNIIVDEARNDHVVLTDFGLVRAAQGSKLTKTGVIIGTPEYMSPEQAQGEEIDWRTDIYSLGVVLYQMLTGTVPFVRSTSAAVLLAHVAHRPPSISQINRAVPKAVEAVALKALAKDRGQRHQSAGQLVNDFQVAITGRMPAGLKPPTAARVGPPLPAVAPRAPITPPPTATAQKPAQPGAVAPRKMSVPLLILGGLGIAVLGVLCIVAVLAAPQLLSKAGGARTPQASPSPGLMVLSPPSLGKPADGAVFAPGDTVTLAWEAVSGLAADDSYTVTLNCASSASGPQAMQVKGTSYVIPSSLYSSLAEPYQCNWSVTAMAKAGAAPSAPSDTRQFSWRKSASTPRATTTLAPTPTLTPPPTPTATRLPPTSTPPPPPTATAAPQDCQNGKEWNGKECVCPKDTVWSEADKWCAGEGGGVKPPQH